MAKETFSSLIDLFKSSSSTSVATLVCDVCGNKLSVFRKKKPCVECKRQFCSQCLQRCRDRALRCKNCHVLTMRPPLRSALLELRVKDLQHYLNQHNVSTRGCLEKEDLVNVLLRYASSSGVRPTESSSAGNSRHPTSENAGSYPGNSGVGAVPLVTVPTPSSAAPNHTSTPQFQPDGVQMRVAPAVSSHGDSDSSSDTSFEIVQRPSSDENITFVHSSSSSNSVSVASSQDNPTPVAAEASGVSFPRSQREPETPQSNPGTPEAPVSTQTTVEEAAEALESLSAPSQVTEEFTVTPDIVIESDLSNIETQEEAPDTNPLSQPVSQPNSSNNSSNNSPNLLRGTMATITSEADFEALSVKNLKDILHRHRVNYHGCCEKAELVDRAKRLYRDYCSSRAELEKLEMDALCKICMDAPVECVMLECGHMATCTDCGRQLSECPICRQFVVRIVRTFKA